MKDDFSFISGVLAFKIALITTISQRHAFHLRAFLLPVAERRVGAHSRAFIFMSANNALKFSTPMHFLRALCHEVADRFLYRAVRLGDRLGKTYYMEPWRKSLLIYMPWRAIYDACLLFSQLMIATGEASFATADFCLISAFILYFSSRRISLLLAAYQFQDYIYFILAHIACQAARRLGVFKTFRACRIYVSLFQLRGGRDSSALLAYR